MHVTLFLLYKKCEFLPYSHKSLQLLQSQRFLIGTIMIHSIMNLMTCGDDGSLPLAVNTPCKSFLFFVFFQLWGTFGPQSPTVFRIRLSSIVYLSTHLTHYTVTIGTRHPADVAHPYSRASQSLPRPPKLRSRTFRAPSSRPMSPQEQLNIMYSQEEKMKALQKEPDERDLEASSIDWS